MYKKIMTYAFLICFSFSVLHAAEGKSDKEMFKQLESGKISVKNPFEMQLPIVMEEPEPDLPKNLPPEESAEGLKTTAPVEPETILRPIPILNIKGVVWNTDRPQAIIDNKIVNIGDTIAEVHITAIHPSGIEATFDGRTVTLPYKGVKHE